MSNQVVRMAIYFKGREFDPREHFLGQVFWKTFPIEDISSQIKFNTPGGGGMSGQWTCQRKRKYTKKLAFAIARKRNSFNGANGTAYECDQCGGWHVTKQAKPWPLEEKK